MSKIYSRTSSNQNDPAKLTKTFIFTVNTQFWILILNGIKKWRDFDPRILHHHRQITWVTFNEPPQLPRHETGILWPQKVVITHLGKSVSTAQCQSSSVKILIFWEGHKNLNPFMSWRYVLIKVQLFYKGPTSTFYLTLLRGVNVANFCALLRISKL